NVGQLFRLAMRFGRGVFPVALAAIVLAGDPPAARGADQAEGKVPRQAVPIKAAIPLAVFHALAGEDEAGAQTALKRIGDNWQNAYAGMLLEMVGFLPSRRVQAGVIAQLEKASGVRFDGDINRMYEWLWSIETGTHPDYAEFKAAIYAPIDPRFREYFDQRPRAAIRLDEIRWGGVRRDGIPPLVNPKMITAREATYLQDDNLVFGVAIDGDVRAYAKRILAWHEMFRDTIAGRQLNGVYCTLCGSMILYDTTVGGVHYELGTSGFLYRSNKLMYDHATKSLWSTLTGTPVVGPLVGKGIELPPLHVVTTTWKEWKKRHPQTLVLSLDTGYQRDYGEGVAYQEYFATDRLMFNVPKLDSRLANKAEVLALRFAESPDEQLAIASDFLGANRVYHDAIGRRKFVVLTDASGANRVYAARDIVFASWNGDDTARDRAGRDWKVTESQLDGPGGAALKRLPAHRAFWFGWYSAYPDTRLVK
ncbi:MAG: DUF3179 domain-containing protein, partial [Burkholderiales bacterium]